MAEKYIVTPWEVKGNIDYEKLIKEFGTKHLTDALVDKLAKIAGKGHIFLDRKVFFSHRDFDSILNWHNSGKEFALYTGRGPSGHTHLGHMLPWIFTKYLQDAFGAELYFQLTDDEKFLYHPKFSLKETTAFAYENTLDIIACGFDPKKTFIFTNTEYAKTMYNISLEIAKRTTASTAKAVFGFKNETNVGMYFFPAMQAAPCFLPTVKKGKEIPVLIPAAIDQDPYWRGIARQFAPKIGWPKPAQIHCSFLPGLGEGGKMSASQPDTAIFTTDSQEDIKRKVVRAFTGGRPTTEEQRKLGGRPEICSVHKYYYYLFSPDDNDLKKLYADCKSGKMLCGECKAILAKRVQNFLAEHQKKREKAKSKVEKFMLRD